MAPSSPLEPRPWLKQYDPQVPPQLDYPLVPIYRLLDETAARQPDRPCANFLGWRFTYRQIKESSDHAAGLSQLGVRTGDRVGLLPKAAASASQPFLVNVHLGKTDFRKGSISI